jgi:hypothetical protein
MRAMDKEEVEIVNIVKKAGGSLNTVIAADRACRLLGDYNGDRTHDKESHDMQMDAIGEMVAEGFLVQCGDHVQVAK